VSQPEATCGESDEVAQVSMTSGSAMNPPGLPRCDSSKPGGTSDDGSTGSAASSARMGEEWSGSPSVSSRYQTGKGTPKNRCRLISQSPLSPSTQFSYRWRMCSGTHWISRPRATRASRSSAERPPLRMYHCRVVTISSGLSPFS
jgi:hypothetical protein